MILMQLSTSLLQYVLPCSQEYHVPPSIQCWAKLTWSFKQGLWEEGYIFRAVFSRPRANEKLMSLAKNVWAFIMHIGNTIVFWSLFQTSPPVVSLCKNRQRSADFTPCLLYHIPVTYGYLQNKSCSIRQTPCVIQLEIPSLYFSFFTPNSL